ncbi:MAG: cupin domain-containing protein [Gammaproteobacteria bacterium]|nr:cupin domain-containing protein [Gammaproteobacteria bacterium]MDH3537885.1 cupin domain-containing protein [Gammaproteobacteria bacterium]
MKAVDEGERVVVNIDEAEFVPYINDRGQEDGLVLQLDTDRPPGTGFHIYKMEPGYTTIPHRHVGNEEFYIISGDITENDGTVYRAGDLVLMKSGTEHCSYTENGCVIVVYLPDSETIDW